MPRAMAWCWRGGGGERLRECAATSKARLRCGDELRLKRVEGGEQPLFFCKRTGSVDDAATVAAADTTMTCALNVLQPVQSVELHTALGYALNQRLEIGTFAGERCGCTLLKMLPRLNALRHHPRVHLAECAGAGKQTIGG